MTIIDIMDISANEFTNECGIPHSTYRLQQI